MTFLENLNKRYAVKKFNGQIVSDEKIQKIKEAIHMTPSSFGTQPYHVHIISDRDILSKLEKYSPNNEVKLQTCSHLFIFSARTDLKSRFLWLNKMQNRTDGFLPKMGNLFQYILPVVSTVTFGRFLTKKSWARNQTYIALGFAMAACAELGIDSSPLEGFNARGFKKILNLSTDIHPSVMLAIGVRSEDDKIYPKLRFPESDLFTLID